MVEQSERRLTQNSVHNAYLMDRPLGGSQLGSRGAGRKSRGSRNINVLALSAVLVVAWVSYAAYVGRQSTYGQRGDDQRGDGVELVVHNTTEVASTPPANPGPELSTTSPVTASQRGTHGSLAGATEGPPRTVGVIWDYTQYGNPNTTLESPTQHIPQQSRVRSKGTRRQEATSVKPRIQQRISVEYDTSCAFVTAVMGLTPDGSSIPDDGPYCTPGVPTVLGANRTGLGLTGVPTLSTVLEHLDALLRATDTSMYPAGEGRTRCEALLFTDIDASTMACHANGIVSSGKKQSTKGGLTTVDSFLWRVIRIPPAADIHKLLTVQRPAGYSGRNTLSGNPSGHNLVNFVKMQLHLLGVDIPLEDLSGNAGDGVISPPLLSRQYIVWVDPVVALGGRMLDADRVLPDHVDVAKLYRHGWASPEAKVQQSLIVAAARHIQHIVRLALKSSRRHCRQRIPRTNQQSSNGVPLSTELNRTVHFATAIGVYVHPHHRIELEATSKRHDMKVGLLHAALASFVNRNERTYAGQDVVLHAFRSYVSGYCDQWWLQGGASWPCRYAMRPPADSTAWDHAFGVQQSLNVGPSQRPYEGGRNFKVREKASFNSYKGTERFMDYRSRMSVRSGDIRRMFSRTLNDKHIFSVGTTWWASAFAAYGIDPNTPIATTRKPRPGRRSNTQGLLRQVSLPTPLRSTVLWSTDVVFLGFRSVGGGCDWVDEVTAFLDEWWGGNVRGSTQGEISFAFATWQRAVVPFTVDVRTSI